MKTRKTLLWQKKVKEEGGSAPCQQTTRCFASIIKTTATTEEVSSRAREKGRWEQKRHRDTLCVREKPRADLIIDLQAGRGPETIAAI
jgi:hypothetical protein